MPGSCLNPRKRAAAAAGWTPEQENKRPRRPFCASSPPPAVREGGSTIRRRSRHHLTESSPLRENSLSLPLGRSDVLSPGKPWRPLGSPNFSRSFRGATMGIKVLTKQVQRSAGRLALAARNCPQRQHAAELENATAACSSFPAMSVDEQQPEMDQGSCGRCDQAAERAEEVEVEEEDSTARQLQFTEDQNATECSHPRGKLASGQEGQRIPEWFISPPRMRATRAWRQPTENAFFATDPLVLEQLDNSFTAAASSSRQQRRLARLHIQPPVCDGAKVLEQRDIDDEERTANEGSDALAQAIMTQPKGPETAFAVCAHEEADRVEEFAEGLASTESDGAHLRCSSPASFLDRADPHRESRAAIESGGDEAMYLDFSLRKLSARRCSCNSTQSALAQESPVPILPLDRADAEQSAMGSVPTSSLARKSCEAVNIALPETPGASVPLPCLHKEAEEGSLPMEAVEPAEPTAESYLRLSISTPPPPVSANPELPPSASAVRVSLPPVEFVPYRSREQRRWQATWAAARVTAAMGLAFGAGLGSTFLML
eukprot:NODE_582_length_2078_cov_30.924101_g537_i0.p1 GENE.NODE_582_length_2078_cov_30.924101_g537_i0~~NODE_582_length_2078_cov_30.924101_g537_i0.p1  ORF type:complete len:545 (-),score=82.43 NODE_582_length_2078_cov_30.924101_g537_i0:350-1984(-)